MADQDPLFQKPNREHPRRTTLTASRPARKDGARIPRARPFGLLLHPNTGEWTDENDLVHLRARYYAPGMGRFTSRDTMPGNSWRPYTFNFWNYAFDNPVSFSDPSGNCPVGFICSDVGGANMSIIIGDRAYGPDCESTNANIGWLTINMNFAENLLGYKAGWLRLPYHKDYWDNEKYRVNSKYKEAFGGNPNDLFPWEGVANIGYGEHSALHPLTWENSYDRATYSYFVDHFLGEAAGIMQTTVNRTHHSSYNWRWDEATPNLVALSGGQFAQRRIDYRSNIYKEFYGLAYMVVMKNFRILPVELINFAHSDKDVPSFAGPQEWANSPIVRGVSPLPPEYQLNDVLTTDTVGFSADTCGECRKDFWIETLYPWIKVVHPSDEPLF